MIPADCFTSDSELCFRAMHRGMARTSSVHGFGNRVHVNGTVLAPVRAAPRLTALPRVLYVVNMHPGQKFGSLEEQIVFLHRAFAEEGSRFVALFSCADAPNAADSFARLGMTTHCLDLQRFRVGALKNLWQLTRRNDIDIVHWNLTHPLANAYLWALSALRPGLRHFYTDHVSRGESPHVAPRGWRRICKKLLLKRYEQVWCVSEFVRNCLATQGTWPALRCCPHFVNTDRFRPDAAERARLRREHGLHDRFIVTVIAQLIPEKGIDLAIRALAQLPERALLWIVGSGPQADELRGLTATLGLEQRVRFWGLQRHVEPILQASDCFVLASRWQEAAGLVVLEAQAAGLPVVASRIGGIPEYLEDGQSGFLFTPGDVNDLATHLRQLCADPPRCERMGRAARLLAEERFSVESRLPEWLELYRCESSSAQRQAVEGTLT